jgi:hypothetical protein
MHADLDEAVRKTFDEHGELTRGRRNIGTADDEQALRSRHGSRLAGEIPGEDADERRRRADDDLNTLGPGVPETGGDRLEIAERCRVGDHGHRLPPDLPQRLGDALGWNLAPIGLAEETT